LPTEHGGWGLTLEPVLLGLVVRYSAAGLCLSAIAFLAFFARTPLKVLLVDAHRGRELERDRLARKVFVIEGAVILGLAVAAVQLAAAPFWQPLLVMVPLVGLELWFDMLSRGRRLVPELAGAVGIAGVVALVTMAGGASTEIALACWLILAARCISAIVTVKDLVGSIHGRPRQPRLVLEADAAALAVAVVATLVTPAVTPGAVAVVLAIAAQRVLQRFPTPKAAIIGVRQTALGLIVVAATAIGVLTY
jgi:hypothetical protein